MNQKAKKIHITFGKRERKTSTTPDHGYEDAAKDPVLDQMRDILTNLNATPYNGDTITDCVPERVEHAQGMLQQPIACTSDHSTSDAQALINPRVTINPIQLAPPVVPELGSYGTYFSPPDPLAAMECFNRNMEVTKKFIRNQKELCRNAIMSANQSALAQEPILRLQAYPLGQGGPLHLPPLIANTANYLHQLTGFDPVGLALAVLASISIATQGRIKVKLAPHWLEPAIDMVLEVAESGKMKTSVIEVLKRPFTAYAKKIHEERGTRHKAKRIAQTLAKKTADKIAQARVKEAMDSGGDIASAIEKAALEAKAILTPYDDLNMPDVKLLLSKGTPHQVAKRLQEQGMCQGCITDEGDMLRSGLLGKNGDPELFLKGHTQGEYAYPSAGGDINVRPSLPMINFVTPAVVADLYSAEAKNGVEGVTARLLPYFLAGGGGGGNPSVSETAFAEYYSKINELLEVYHTQEASAEKYKVDVTPEAVKLLYSFKDEIQDKIIPNMPEAAAPYLRKAHGQAARFAWDIHAVEMDSVNCKPHLYPIQASTMEQAIALVKVTFEHVKWIYDPCGFFAYTIGKKVIKSLLRISPEEWQNVLTNGIDSTALQQRTKTTSADMNNALRFLERHNALSIYDSGTNNLKIVLHPYFFSIAWTQLGVHLD